MTKSDTLPAAVLYRIEVTRVCDDTKTYIYRDNTGHVHYISPSEIPLALSNLVGEHAATLRFQLEDCDGRQALSIINKVLHTIQVTRGLKQPIARADWYWAKS